MHIVVQERQCRYVAMSRAAMLMVMELPRNQAQCSRPQVIPSAYQLATVPLGDICFGPLWDNIINWVATWVHYHKRHRAH